MTTMPRILLGRLAALALAAVVAGCTSSQPVRYFALTPLSDEVPVAETEQAIGVAPITLASYLDRNGIVTRTSPNELTVAGTDNWIEPLDLQIRSVVARNLAQLLGTDRVFLLPEQRLLPLDYTVEIGVERFDIEGGAAATGGEPAAELVVLEGRWSLFKRELRDVLQTAPVRITQPVASPATFERRAAAMSDAVGRLSRIIATAIASNDR
jgi:hypothetical protein